MRHDLQDAFGIIAAIAVSVILWIPIILAARAAWEVLR